MAFGKTSEEKEAEKAAAEQARAQADAAAAAAREQAAFRASPVGQATAAHEANQGFFEVQLVVGSSQRDNTLWAANPNAPGPLQVHTHAGTLAAIEAIGWKLEHAGYVFMITGENSRDKFMATGERTAVSGQTIGIYLFRRTEPPA
jgi:hypothetical protein